MVTGENQSVINSKMQNVITEIAENSSHRFETFNSTYDKAASTLWVLSFDQLRESIRTGCNYYIEKNIVLKPNMYNSISLTCLRSIQRTY